jgi:hypothetical protein
MTELPGPERQQVADFLQPEPETLRSSHEADAPNGLVALNESQPHISAGTITARALRLTAAHDIPASSRPHRNA